MPSYLGPIAMRGLVVLAALREVMFKKKYLPPAIEGNRHRRVRNPPHWITPKLVEQIYGQYSIFSGKPNFHKCALARFRMAISFDKVANRVHCVQQAKSFFTKLLKEPVVVLFVSP